PDAEPFVVVVRDGDGSILGLAPLCRLRYRDLGYRLNALAWAGRDVVSGDFLDFLSVRSARSAVVSAILTFLSGPTCRWSVLQLGSWSTILTRIVPSSGWGRSTGSRYVDRRSASARTSSCPPRSTITLAVWAARPDITFGGECATSRRRVVRSMCRPCRKRL